MSLQRVFAHFVKTGSFDDVQLALDDDYDVRADELFIVNLECDVAADARYGLLVADALRAADVVVDAFQSGVSEQQQQQQHDAALTRAEQADVAQLRDWLCAIVAAAESDDADTVAGVRDLVGRVRDAVASVDDAAIGDARRPRRTPSRPQLVEAALRGNVPLTAAAVAARARLDRVAALIINNKAAFDKLGMTGLGSECNCRFSVDARVPDAEAKPTADDTTVVDEIDVGGIGANVAGDDAVDDDDGANARAHAVFHDEAIIKPIATIALAMGAWLSQLSDSLAAAPYDVDGGIVCVSPRYRCSHSCRSRLLQRALDSRATARQASCHVDAVERRHVSSNRRWRCVAP